MLDLNNLISAAEALALATQLSGDAQYILRTNVERCEAKRFVWVAGGLRVGGDLRLDWSSPPWRGAKVCGLVVEGDLEVEGSLTNLDSGGGPVLVVLGSVKADRIVQGGASWMIRGDVRVRHTFFGFYNDGYVSVGGDLVAEAVINEDHDIAVAGRVVGHSIDDEHGHAWLAEGLVDADGMVQWELVSQRAERGEPLVRTKPAAIDILLAAEEPGSELLAAALASGANTEVRSPGGNTPLLRAIAFGRRENVKLLLDAGADVTVTDDDGEGVAHGLAGSRNEAVIDLVLARRPPLDLPDRKGGTPMALAIEYRNMAAVRRFHAAGIPLPAPDKKRDGFPYSLLLAESPNVDLLAFLVEQRVDLDWHSSEFLLSDGYTLLHEAAWRGNERSVELLLKAGLAADARDARGRTPLRLMLELASITPVLVETPQLAGAIAQRLLSAGADPLARSNDGRDALDAALAANADAALRVVYEAAAKSGRLDPVRRAAAEQRLAGSR